jgi:hypothetical protein
VFIPGTEALHDMLKQNGRSLKWESLEYYTTIFSINDTWTNSEGLDAERFSETSVSSYKFTRRYNPEEQHRCFHRRENHRPNSWKRSTALNCTSFLATLVFKEVKWLNCLTELKPGRYYQHSSVMCVHFSRLYAPVYGITSHRANNGVLPPLGIFLGHYPLPTFQNVKIWKHYVSNSGFVFYSKMEIKSVCRT